MCSLQVINLVIRKAALTARILSTEKKTEITSHGHRYSGSIIVATKLQVPGF